MSDYQLYEEILTSAAQGTPLWEPVTIHPPSIGDVGYLRQGAFIRLFNATLPPGHKDNENGEPENYVPLAIQSASVQRTVLPKGVIATSGVQITAPPQEDTRIHFQCTNKSGAVIMSNSDVHRQDISGANLTTFREYTATHAYSWAKFACFQLMHEVALHELILLTGCDLTSGHYSVTAFSSARVSKRGRVASFQLSPPALTRHFWSHSPEIGDFHHNYGPGNTGRHTHQCLFIRGFKIMDRGVRRAERESEAASCVVDISATTPSRNPLDAILRYLTDKLDMGVAVVHDDDIIKAFGKENIPYDYRTVVKKLRKRNRFLVAGGKVP